MTATPKELLEGLPATLDALLEHPERHKPEVVERLLEVADELRRDDPERVMDAGCRGRSRRASG